MKRRERANEFAPALEVWYVRTDKCSRTLREVTIIVNASYEKVNGSGIAQNIESDRISFCGQRNGISEFKFLSNASPKEPISRGARSWAKPEN
jgi:hypothetical protein